MPTLYRGRGYRFFIVKADCRERMHVHVEGGKGFEAKIWLMPTVSVAFTRGYTLREMSLLQRIAESNVVALRAAWEAACADYRT